MSSPALATREAGGVGGEYSFTNDDFRTIAAILHKDSGIHLPEGKMALVYSRLAKRLRHLGLRSFREYCAYVAGPEGAEERSAMLRALTTNVTRFFRESHHFDHLKERLAGGLAAKVRAGGRLRIWSAGCSTGEEPYSIALTLLSVIPNAAELDIRILATDIDTNVIAKAMSATYSAEVLKEIPPGLRSRFKTRGAEAEVDESARALISFRELNLMADWPMKGRFDAIFCRNVAIYFEEPVQERLWGRFGDKLQADGRLYIGHSERVDDQRFATDGQTVYRLARPK
ncbi:MAG TPA: protein-glutamate O-methyltransferase [Hyphomonadaceae bacterium]|nr:protein-glutamate O-methyltransferase [Hyphomonadaceae bacterium]